MTKRAMGNRSPVEPGPPGLSLSPSITPKILDHTRCLNGESTRRNRSGSDFEIETFAHLSAPFES
jgi:hypothetical protein